MLKLSALLACLLAGSSFAFGSTYKAAPCDVGGMRELLVQQVNAARARGARCGATVFKAAPPVRWNEQLYRAASAHSRDMAEQNYFDHVSRRGTQPADRVQAQGYHWMAVAENIAAGAMYTANTVVGGWMDSPGHCSNIMGGEFNEVAVACVERPGTAFGSYWTMVLGRR